MPEATLPAWAAQATDELHACDRWADALARNLTTDELNWRPAPDAWSVGQCLHHLYVTNEQYLPPIAKALDGRAVHPVQEITPGWFSRYFIRNYIAPPAPGATVKTRARAPRQIAPAVNVDPSVLDQLLRTNVAARDLIRRAASFDVNRIRFQNPFVPLIRFTIGTGVEVIWKHQRRHLAQAERIVESPAFPRHPPMHRNSP
jgi:DinB superfamily